MCEPKQVFIFHSAVFYNMIRLNWTWKMFTVGGVHFSGALPNVFRDDGAGICVHYRCSFFRGFT